MTLREAFFESCNRVGYGLTVLGVCCIVLRFFG